MRAGARFIIAAATGLDSSQRRVILEGRPPLDYDTISFDVGSTIAGLDRPGVAEHAIDRSRFAEGRRLCGAPGADAHRQPPRARHGWLDAPLPAAAGSSV
jgi:hypothetical protein